ncbi:ABC transporter ATP-binding protein [Synergistales bacterium]|nr:ABC transporter ATP-binding protein [Synergistales bacterium]
MSVLLEIKNLRVSFGGERNLMAVAGADISIDRGEIIGLVGESGCGKTMTALAAMGLLPDSASKSGEILFEGENLLEKSDACMRRLRGNRMSMIFQDPASALNPVLTIGKQLREPFVLHRRAARSAADARAKELLSLVGVPQPEDRMRSYPHQLSGGLCQRVMIAMALMCEPDLIIADEPTTALDVTIQAQILSLLSDLRGRLGTAIFLITHDLGVVAELCDRVYVMYSGYVVEHADVHELFASPLHPYASGLLNSIPRIDATYGGDELLYSIPGMVPDITERTPGCPFAPRCENAEDKCRNEIPALAELRKGHFARCLNVKKG